MTWCFCSLPSNWSACQLTSILLPADDAPNDPERAFALGATNPPELTYGADCQAVSQSFPPVENRRRSNLQPSVNSIPVDRASASRLERKTAG